MRRENIYLSTVADDASKVARKYGLGIIKEIEDLCKNRYEGTLRFDFGKMMEDKTVRAFFGL